MRYQELFEYFDDLHAYWFNLTTNKIIELEEGSSHAFDVVYKPEKYGFSKEGLSKYLTGSANQALRPGAITIDNLPDMALLLDGNSDIIKLMLSRGWVRIVVDEEEIDISADNTKKAAKAAKALTNMYPTIDTVNVSISKDGSEREDYDSLTGKRLQMFLKNGSFPSKNVFEKKLTESATLHSFWININTGKILPSPEEHLQYVIDQPEKFGLDPETIQQIRQAYSGNLFPPLMELVGEQGWVRGGKDFDPKYKNAYFLQGYSNEHLHIAANILAEYTYVDLLSLDTFFETFSSSSFTKIHSDELEHWLKTGKFFTKSRTNEDAFRKAPCVPTALQRVTNASDEEITQVCQKHRWSPRSGMNIGQTIGALKSLGFDYKSRTPLLFYRAKLKDGRIVTKTRTLNQLLKVIPDGKFLVGVRNHTIAIIDGKIFDDAEFGLKHKVYDIIEVKEQQ